MHESVRDAEIRKECANLLNRIVDTLNTAGRKRVLKHFQEKKAAQTLTELRDEWEAYFILDFGTTLYDENRAKFNKACKKHKFETELGWLQKLPTSGAVRKSRALKIFDIFADTQETNLVQGLLNFLLYCETRGFQLEVYDYDSHRLGVMIDDISVYLDPSHIRTRYTDEIADPEITQPIPLTYPTFISKEEATANDEVSLSPLDHHSIPLIGREEQLKELNRFLNFDEKGVRILAVIAPSGAGKTRLITEWMHMHVNKSDWECGLVEDVDQKPWTDWKPSKNTLIVIDYIYRFDAVIHAIIKKAEICNDFYIRLVVLDHVFPERLEDLPYFDHFTTSFAEDEKEISRRKALFHPVMHLDKLPERLPMLLNIVSKVSGESMESSEVQQAKALLVSIEKAEQDENLTASAYPLFAILIGEAIKDPNQSISQWKRRDVIRHYLQNKRRIPWAKGRVTDKDVLGKWVGAWVSAATIRRGHSFNALKNALSLQVEMEGEDLNKISAWCNRVVSSDDRSWLKPFEPDILGENFFLLFFKEFAYATTVRSLFINILCLQGASEQLGEEKSNDVVGKFIEFVQRLARNLANDQSDTFRAQEDWETLSAFLNPLLYNEDELLYFAASSANMIVANILKQKGLTEYIQLYCRQVDKNVLMRFAGSQYAQLASEAMFYLFELSTDIQRQNYDFQDELIVVAEKLRQNTESKPSPIYQAAFFDCKYATEILCSRLPKDIDKQSNNGWSALMLAASKGHEDCVQVLIKAKVPMNSVDKIGRTALILAAGKGHESCVQALIEAKVILDVGNENGISAIMVAACEGHNICLQALIEAKANLDSRNKDGVSALMIAASNGHKDCVEALVKAKASPDTVNNDDWSALMLAASFGHADCVKTLIRAKASLDCVSKDGFSALMLAASNGHKECVQTLIKAKASLDSVSKDGFSPLMLAASFGHADCVKTLIKAKSPLDSVNKGGFSTLMIAAYNGYEDCVQALIKAKAPLDIVDKDGTSALMMAAHKGHTDCVKTLIKAKAPLDSVDKNGWSALMLAASFGYEDCVEALIKAKASLDCVSKDGFSALMIAASFGYEDCVEALIKAKASLDCVSKDGFSALMIAASNNHKDCVRALIKAKIPLDSVIKHVFPRNVIFP